MDQDGRYPDGNWAKANVDLGGVSCAVGGCLRMRPSFSGYNGHWGDFSGPTLSHYKFFCQLEEQECQKRMAMSLYGFLTERSLSPASTEAEFRQVAREYLCPVYKDRTLTEKCFAELALADIGQGNPFLSFVVRDPQLSCNLRACSGKMTCDDRACGIEGRVSKDSTTLVSEYLHFLNGFRQLTRR
ncbi:MAG: hypothetical protein EOO38_23465 [Cytophagaceae bacterium]|nr:MAG: hypothetical protein EOO38_23465 [Cytophagaceae bacterium]